MNLMQYWRDKEEPKLSAYLDIFRSLGPGLIVAVGFVDPGNWASNVAAGSEYGYQLLWVVTLSTIMLIILQHNAAHLGIVSGKCLSEASTAYMDRRLKISSSPRPCSPPSPRGWQSSSAGPSRWKCSSAFPSGSARFSCSV